MSTSSDLIGQRTLRLEHTQELRNLGIDPYPSSVQKDCDNHHVTSRYDTFIDKTVTLAGRLISKREHGKLIFGDLIDQSGRIQIGIKQDQLIAEITNGFLDWDHLYLVDTGDFIQVTGTVSKTQQGEITLFVKKLKVIVKTIRPLPHGFEDKELRFRRRYVDFTVNPKTRNIFLRKSLFWQKAREFMIKRGFIEVETPVLELVTGGADAKPFTTHHNALDQDFYLRISSELYQKRLIGGGFEKVFVLGPNFRNEGIDDEHLQEYYQLEYYWAYSDIEDTIQLTKDLYMYLAQEVWGKTKFTRNGLTFDLAGEWQVIDYVKAIKERFDIDVFEDSLEKMHEVIKKNGVEIEFEKNRNRLVDNLWKIIRRDIAGPAALINVPKFISPLAKSYFKTPHITKRFQPIIAGSEVGNAYAELNDPVDQLERFLDQQKMRDTGDDEAQMLDIDFVEMLEYGMPPTSCIGFSERLFWFLEGVTAREGTLFPQMRHEIDEMTKKIYAGKVNFEEKKLLPDLNNPELFSIHQSVAEKWPDVHIGFAIIKGIEVKKTRPDLEEEKKNIYQTLSKITTDDINKIPEIQSYRKMYKEMKIDWHSRRPSPEALLRRISQGKNLYTINTCVDAYNLIVLKNHVSSGAFDLDKIEFPTVLRLAKEGETILLLGDSEPTKYTSTEVAYFDQNGGYNIDFNYRDAQRTAVTEQTKNIMINIDGVYSISRKQVEQSLKQTIQIIQKYCGGTVEVAGIVKAQP